ncbi:SDR family NAD(P)-dependent oxidoreductase [Streptomyces sp. SID14478]|uniref:oxidoreductase n=1 Tax=Streptomyces sp. SID14478 TaxID=2706073 RepID=UPI0013D980AE|nr:oxidoreductase [Streptomyces sp. SID14478]NEB77142.1 SDR family NAD(P)-dependent oxidoreductase [Streptomyces sp. SID14478]
MSGWNASDIPDQSGRTAVVTGANTGIGYVTARELARAGARVVLACRSQQRGTAALDRLRREVPHADAEFGPLDLGDLASVREFAAGRQGRPIDLLIDNAGVMALPYGRTADGFETQFGVNHLGHFALTGLLLPSLLDAPGARVVSVSSVMHALANIDIGDLNSEKSYRRWVTYSRSKTANLLFVHELARRVADAGADLVACAAHPGYTSTELHTRGAKMEGRIGVQRFFELGNRVVGQSAEHGALPSLYAATAPGVRPDGFYGPRVLMWRGAPAASWRASWTRNDAAGERLWAASEQLTGVAYAELKS